MPTCLAEAHLWLGDLDVAQTMYRKRWTHACWNRTPPWPCGWLMASGGELEPVARSPLMGEAPTVAERPVLEVLPTHAPLQEIAETLFVSRNTVKSHTLSICRKLDVSSRRDAVTKARALGLLRRSAWPPDFTRTGGGRQPRPLRRLQHPLRCVAHGRRAGSAVSWGSA